MAGVNKKVEVQVETSNTATTTSKKRQAAETADAGEPS